jgi:hypothetical protein
VEPAAACAATAGASAGAAGRSRAVWPNDDARRMSGGDATMTSLTGTLVIQNANIAVLSKSLNQQKLEGRAAVALIQAGGAVAPPKGAPEPGKGSLVDVVA